MAMDFEINLTADDYGLTPSTRSAATARRMNKVLMLWLTHSNWNDNKLCEEAGIDRRTLIRYRENEGFMAQYDKCCKMYFRTLQNKALEALERRLDKDDMTAVKYALDGNCYGATQKVEVESNNTINISIEE